MHRTAAEDEAVAADNEESVTTGCESNAADEHGRSPKSRESLTGAEKPGLLDELLCS